MGYCTSWRGLLFRKLYREQVNLSIRIGKENAEGRRVGIHSGLSHR